MAGEQSWVDRVVLVTGAGQAGGRMIAEDLAKRGARVVVNDIVDDNGQETVGRIEAAGGVAHFVHADVSVETDFLTSSMPPCPPTAGSTWRSTTPAPSCLSPIADSDAAGFASVIAVNLEGVRACLEHEVRAMRSNGGGAIVNRSSVTSDLTAAPNNGLYGATKGGVDALTQVTAVEVAKDGISVNALAFHRR